MSLLAVAAAVAVMAGAALQSAVGFGFALVAAPLLYAAAPSPAAGHGDPPRWARPAAGLASGALNTSTSTGGPPAALLLMARGLPPAAVRDTLTAAFVAFAAVSAVALALSGADEALPQTA